MDFLAPRMEFARSLDVAGGGDLGDLPEWNLDDLYKGEDADELTAQPVVLAVDTNVKLFLPVVSR